MSKDAKIWKPGQLVTIDNKVYRIVKRIYGCVNCENKHTEPFNTPCIVCSKHRHPSILRPYYSWILKELKPNK